MVSRVAKFSLARRGDQSMAIFSPRLALAKASTMERMARLCPRGALVV